MKGSRRPSWDPRPNDGPGLWSLWTQSTLKIRMAARVQELCESRGGHPGLPVPNSPYGLYGRKATFNQLKTNLLLSAGKVIFPWFHY